MKVLFIANHHLDNNSGLHIFNLANHLTKLGVKCIVCVPSQKEKVTDVGLPLFETINFADIEKSYYIHSPDIIHAWTPREIVRQQTEALLKIKPCQYIVHMEDNEEHLISAYTKVPFKILKRIPASILSFISRPNLIHPKKYIKFLENSNGITVVIDKLKLICPPHPPKEVIWAGYQDELNWSRLPDTDIKHKLHLENDELIITYTGNIHSANYNEVKELYKAISLINMSGVRVKLIRTGTDYIRYIDNQLRDIRKKYCLELGHVPRHILPSLISISDILIQPGRPGEFNDYRFPSKLPEYLASGKPVILPRTNIGLHLRDGDNCIFLTEGKSFEIAQRADSLLSNKELRTKIGNRGQQFAKKNLKWEYITQKLYSFYTSLV